jgi:cold shock CspA family protein
MQTQVETGTIKNYNRDRGFGFIARDCQPDIFFHVKQTDCEDEADLTRGRVVEFEPDVKDGRTRAINVVLR